MLRSFGAKPSSIRQKKNHPKFGEHAAVVFSGWPCEVWTKPTVASLGHVTCVKQEEFPTGNPHPMPSLNPEIIWSRGNSMGSKHPNTGGEIPQSNGAGVSPPTGSLRPADPPTKIPHRIFISGKKIGLACFFFPSKKTIRFSMSSCGSFLLIRVRFLKKTHTHTAGEIFCPCQLAASHIFGKFHGASEWICTLLNLEVGMPRKF